MAHTFTNLLAHIIFSTKDRAPFIDMELKPELHAYLGGMVREIKGKAYSINGTADHVHLLISLPPTLALSDAMKVVKANSSRWVSDKWGERKNFGWQIGYGAFSVSKSNVPGVAKYIENQEEHHRKITFKEEFLEFLRKHGIEYDERYIWE
ncbi:MAG: REP-associated tyrosine transposase [Acidobacteriota bacterium]|jgi:REP element-mobilizing transposase RayT|nr:REP-associated tyrosine transposase [Acidobacteriota bacterium]